MAVRGKREMKRKKNPLMMALGAVFAAAVLFTAGWVFLKPSGHDRKVPEEPEVPAFSNIVEPVKQEQTVPELDSVSEPAELTG